LPIYAALPEVSSAEPALSKDIHLLIELIKRDLRARFSGSAFGLLWTVLQPLSLVGLYWFVFTQLIPGGMGRGEGYGEFLIAALLPWLGVNEGLIRSTTAVVDNATLLRKLPLRAELLVVVPNASALVLEIIGLTIFLVFLAARGMLSPSLWVLPLALVLQFTLQVGIGWLLAIVCVFFRDLTQFMGFALSFVFYLSPILYSVAPRFEPFFFWNPMTPLLGLFRNALLSSPLPATGSIVFLVVVAAGAWLGGLSFFRHSQATLADYV
jgi:ABC-type polysaccharide/polyol phosphate export permease